MTLALGENVTSSLTLIDPTLSSLCHVKFCNKWKQDGKETEEEEEVKERGRSAKSQLKSLAVTNFEMFCGNRKSLFDLVVSL